MIIWQNLTAQQQQQLLARPAIADNQQLSAGVEDIITQVKTQGDRALFSLTEKFDGISLSTLKVSPAQITQAKKALSTERLAAINTAYEQIKSFHQAQQPQDVVVETRPGVVCTLTSQAIESVGLYIPAGSAPLPSTVLMLGVPAKLADCARKVLVCPPDKNGQLADEVLVAADLCGIEEIYTLGGAQAIAALAYGTQTIAPVCKVFGPGNRYVTEAKKQLSQQVPGFAIDMPAGPSEVLVIADGNSNPAFVAADLLSQAEHGPDSQVVLVTDSKALIAEVEQALTQQLAQLSRRDIAEQALSQSRLILTDNLTTAVQVSNQYAPEHLIIQTENPKALLAGIRNAGSVFLGAYTPESAGDYASGTNHVLPTYGYSKVCSSLSLADFYRRFTVQEITKAGLAGLAPCITELTDAEGLDGHKRAVTIRLEPEKAQDIAQNQAPAADISKQGGSNE
ncbi:histidinol dehydrogenase [Thalassomonas viridans]|uniref:Histidinol dehydrogenase n=1 Tax=Thalassomonas viridans TaxID=137584 RepID=A0AAE9YYW1_9GAMM|nr:histidinol dehydrogenase [Thalassomonas viridans]WDE03535.1 histidinol dehydrogenase [Thalassomonas viridans]